MALKNDLAELVNALLLLGCALSAGLAAFAFAFAIGDGDGQSSAADNALLISTLVGIIGLVIASLGSRTRHPAMCVLALVSVLIVMPAVVLYARWNFHAYMANARLGMHFNFLDKSSTMAPPFLCLAAAILSVVRFQQLR